MTREIIEHLGVISKAGSGWTKEVNLVSWNSDEPKIDIRSWSPDHEKCGKGITLTADETEVMMDILYERDLGSGTKE